MDAAPADVPRSGYLKSMARSSVIRSDEPKKKILSLMIGPPSRQAIVESAQMQRILHRSDPASSTESKASLR